MPSSTLIKNCKIVNEGEIFNASVIIKDQKIYRIIKSTIIDSAEIIAKLTKDVDQCIDANGKYLLPGIIDDQVHFREPGFTHKADIASESRAALAGGTTSLMEMPNTKPQTTTVQALEEKFKIAENNSFTNYSFYMGASNDNLQEILKINPKKVCGVKVFMGSSTGNMLVDNKCSLEAIFAEAPTLIATHCEDEQSIRANLAEFQAKYGDDIPVTAHPLIRSEEACYKSSSLAAELATKYNSRLHILHLSTAKELALFSNKKNLVDKRITGEACVHHLYFSEQDYHSKGVGIKCNPAIKTEADRDALLAAINNDTLDVIATDHAPHLWSEKEQSYAKSAAGIPLVQHSLHIMLELYLAAKISLEKIIEKMCHAPAICFQIEKRGFIREGYWADLVLVEIGTPESEWTVDKSNILYKCAWSPLEGHLFRSKISHTIVNGEIAYDNGQFYKPTKTQALSFER